MLPVDVVRRREGGGCVGRRPALLLEARVGQRRVVWACCGLALAAGVRIGMAVSEARALVMSEGVSVEEAQPGRDARVLRALAVWAGRFSPVVAVDGADGLLIDVTGCEAIFGGEARLLGLALVGLRALGFEARGAIAGTYGCAWAAARYRWRGGAGAGWGGEEQELASGRGVIVESGREREVMEGLPVAALRVGAEVVEGLAEVGIDRVGQVLAVPRAALPARFGAELNRQVDLALGRAAEMIEPVRVVEAPSVERVFDGPTASWEAVSITARELLGALAEELRAREKGVRRLDVELTRCGPGGKRIRGAAVVIGLARATRDVHHLWSLLGPRLERVPLGDGGDSGDGVDGVRLTARWTERIAHGQAAWVSGGEMGAGARAGAELIDILANRLGPARVVRAELVESHVPERAVRWPSAGKGVEAARCRGVEGGREVRLGVVGDRPTVLLAEASPAWVVSVTPDGPVARVRWMGADLEVRACLGPERIEGEWWRGGVEARDYYRVCDQHGRWLWMYRELGGSGWYVQGVWG